MAGAIKTSVKGYFWERAVISVGADECGCDFVRGEYDTSDTLSFAFLTPAIEHARKCCRVPAHSHDVMFMPHQSIKAMIATDCNSAHNNYTKFSN